MLKFGVYDRNAMRVLMIWELRGWVVCLFGRWFRHLGDRTWEQRERERKVGFRKVAMLSLVLQKVRVLFGRVDITFNIH